MALEANQEHVRIPERNGGKAALSDCLGDVRVSLEFMAPTLPDFQSGVFTSFTKYGTFS